MKTEQTVTLLAFNKAGASVEFKGTTKSNARKNFYAKYDRRGWKISYYTITNTETK